MFAIFIVLVAIATTTQAFFLHPSRLNANRLCMTFNFDRAVNTLSSNKILTKTSQLGLLSRLERAGFTLSSAAPLLKFADEQDLIGVLEASSDNVLPLIAKAIDLSPALLPIAGIALKTPPTVLYGGAAASLASAVALIAVVPDDSVLTVALQVGLGIPLGAILPGALGVGGFILTKIK